MLFPMYTISAEKLMEMTRIESHETLKVREPLGSEHGS